MARVDFYILEEASGLKSLHFACQLIEKAYQEQQQIYVHAPSREDAERFDTLLWTYKDDSFIPHTLVETSVELPPPIQIGFAEAPLHHQQTLVNLSKEIPAFYSRFAHIIEIVFSDPLVQQLARERYKQYRDQGCEMNTIKLKVNEI